MSRKNILLVEGEADRGFFEALCQMLGISADVRVATPKDSGGAHNTKEGVLNLLTVLLPQLQDGQLERIGMVVDADRVEHGSGYTVTLQRFKDALAQAGYQPNPAAASGCVCFMRKLSKQEARSKMVENVLAWLRMEQLPAAESELAQQTLKEPYLFDFLGVSNEAAERERRLRPSCWGPRHQMVKISNHKAIFYVAGSAYLTGARGTFCLTGVGTCPPRMMKLCRSGASRELWQSRLAPLLQNIVCCFTLKMRTT